MADTNLAEDQNNVPAQKQEKPVSRNVTRLDTRRAIKNVMDLEQKRIEQGLPDNYPNVIEKKEQETEAARVQALGGTEGSKEVRASMADIMKDEEERADEKDEAA
jgi:hypothetical protein